VEFIENLTLTFHGIACPCVCVFWIFLRACWQQKSTFWCRTLWPTRQSPRPPTLTRKKISHPS